MNLQEFKDQNPAYRDWNDQELADGLHEKFYAEIPKADFYKQIGLGQAAAIAPSAEPTAPADTFQGTKSPAHDLRRPSAAEAPATDEPELRAATEAYNKELGFKDRLGARLARGISDAKKSVARQQAEVEAGRTPNTLGGRQVSPTSPFAATPEEAAEEDPIIQKRLQDFLENVRQEVLTQQEIPMHPAAKAALERGKAGDIEGMMRAFKVDPTGVVAEVGLPSVVTSGPAMIASGGAGLLAGSVKAAAIAAGVGSYATDIQFGIQEGLQKRGYNLEDTARLAEALRNKDLMQEIRQEAGLHALPVAFFDAIGAKLAASTLAFKKLPMLGQEAMNLPTQVIAGAGTGAVGEFSGQVAAGQDVDWGQVFAEAVGEGVTTPGEVGTAAVAGYRELTVEKRLMRRFELAADDAMTRHLSTFQSPEVKALQALDPGARHEVPMQDESATSRVVEPFGAELATMPVEPPVAGQPKVDLGITDPKRVQVDLAIPAAQQVIDTFPISPEAAAAVAIARSQEEGFKPIGIIDNELSQISPALKQRYLTALRVGFKTEAESITEELKQLAEATRKAEQFQGVATPRADNKKAITTLQKVIAVAARDAKGNIASWLKVLQDMADNQELAHVVHGLSERARLLIAEPSKAQAVMIEGLVRYMELLEGRAKGVYNPSGYIASPGVDQLDKTPELGIELTLVEEEDRMVEADNEPVWKKRRSGKESLLSAATKAQHIDQPRGKVWSARRPGARITEQGQQAVVNVLSRWLKKIPGINVVLILGSFNSSGENGLIYADSATLGKNTIQIRMNTELENVVDASGMPTVFFLESLAHELGHGMAEYLLSRSSPLTRQVVYNAYKYWLYDQLKRTTAESFKLSRGSVASSIFGGMMNTDTIDAVILAYVIDPDSHKSAVKYSYGLTEWLAHQFEQKFSSREMQAPVRAYVKKAYQTFKLIWAVTKNDFKPDQTFAQFLAFGKAMVLEQNTMIKQRLIEGFIAEIGARPGSPPPATAPPPNPSQSTREQKQSAQTAAGVVSPSIAKDIWRNIKGILGPNPHAEGFDAHLDNFSKMKRWTAGLLLIARTNQHVTPLTDPFGVRDPQTGEVRYGYLEYYTKWNALRMNWLSRANERMQEWREIDGWFRHKQSAILGAFMLEQSHGGKYLDLSDPAVQKQYPMLPETIALYKRIDEDFKAFISAIEETLLRETAVRMRNNPFLQNELQGIRNKFADLRSRPYAPMTRFGDYTVIVHATQPVTVLGKLYQPGDMIHFEAFDTEREQKWAAKRIQRAFPSGKIKFDMMSESLQTMSGMPRALLESLKDILQLTPEQKKELDEYLYRTAPGHTFIRHMVQRKGISGFSYDLKRAYADYFLHGSNHLARLTYYQAMHDASARLGATATAIQGDAVVRRQLHRYVQRHFDYLMNPAEDWTKARGIIAVLYLGLVIKTAVVNLTQPVFMTWAHLAPVYGNAKALGAIKQAYQDIPKIYRAARPLKPWQQEAITRYVQNLPMTERQRRFVDKWTGFSQVERDALQQAMKEGFIDESFAMELAAMGASSWLNKFQAGTEVGYRVRQVASGVMIPFQAAEKLNRRVSFIASFRLAREAGADYNTAFIMARDTVNQTQFEYGKGNRPELMRGRKGIFMMFMQFPLNTLWFMCGADAGWWRAWAIMLFAGGLMGLPLASNLMDLAEWAYQKWKPNNPAFIRAALKRETAEMFGPGGSDMILHGASRFGFGLVPFGDLSGSISLGRIIPATSVLFGNTGILSGVSRDWDSLATDLVTEGGGAATSLVMRMLQFLASNDPDQWSRIQRGMPTTFGQQVMGAYQWYDRGGVETGSGAKIHKFDLSDPWDLAQVAGMALGIQPREVANKREDAYYAQEAARYFALRREMLLTSLFDRKRLGDTEGAKEVMNEIKDFNQKVPIGILRLGPDAITRSLAQRKLGVSMTENVGGRTTTDIMIGRMLKPQPAVLPPDTPR